MYVRVAVRMMYYDVRVFAVFGGVRARRVVSVAFLCFLFVFDVAVCSRH